MSKATSPSPELVRDTAKHVVDLLWPGGAAHGQRWFLELEDAVLDLSVALPQGREDYDARLLFQFLIELRRALDADPGDATGDVELAIARLRDVSERISRRLEHERLDDAQEAASSIFDAMAGVPARDLSRLLGVSEKTIGTWRAGGAVERNVPRVALVAQLLTYLRPSMTPKGLMMWFDAARPQLHGRAPIELLSDPAGAQDPLTGLARGARAQLGS